MLRRILLKCCLLFLVVMGVSCSKWLDLQPQDGITSAEFWQTKEQVHAAVIGCYASLTGSPTGGRPLAESFFLWGELRADMISATTASSNEEIDVINVNILPTNSIASWRTVYQTINYCNTVIEFAPRVLQRDPTFTETSLKRYVAEMKAMRAWMYFYLVRVFGEVPLKLTATSSDNQVAQIAKSSQDSVLNQVLTDLAAAETDAVFSYGDQASDKGRITKFAINALQADVNLWRERYTEAIAACDKIINSNRFGLISGNSSSAWYNILYVNGNSNESIFELQFDRQRLNPFYTMFLTPRRRFTSSPIVMDEIYTVDQIDPNNRDIRGDGSAVRMTDGTVWKYVGASSTTTRAQEESYAHWIVYRLADVLLMKAEALNESGNGQGALDIIATIRARARALPATAKSPNPSDKIEVGDYILEERAREFAYEGKRWFDLLRNARRNNYQRLDLLTSMVANTVPPDRQQSAIVKIRDKNSHYLPILAYEIQTNKQLVQNPFYR